MRSLAQEASIEQIPNGQNAKQQTILVAGCAGFIGWKVREQPLASGCTVVGMDNLNDDCDARLKLASSSSLYGRENPLLYTEDQPTDRLISPYVASKQAAEALCYTYHHSTGSM